jgi:hypothetical protein
MVLVKKIQEEISLGNVVVLKGFPYNPVRLTPDDIYRHFCLPKHRPVVVSGNYILFL